MKKCIICGKEESKIAYPVVDWVTGFLFCNGCWYDIKANFHRYEKENLSNWLRAIAYTRDLRELIKQYQ